MARCCCCRYPLPICRKAVLSTCMTRSTGPSYRGVYTPPSKRDRAGSIYFTMRHVQENEAKKKKAAGLENKYYELMNNRQGNTNLFTSACLRRLGGRGRGIPRSKTKKSPPGHRGQAADVRRASNLPCLMLPASFAVYEVCEEQKQKGE